MRTKPPAAPKILKCSSFVINGISVARLRWALASMVRAQCPETALEYGMRVQRARTAPRCLAK